MPVQMQALQYMEEGCRVNHHARRSADTHAIVTDVGSISTGSMTLY